MQNFITLENDIALLKPLSMDHASDLLKITIDKAELLKYSPSENHTEEKLHNYISTALDQKSRGSRFPYTIIDKRDSTIAGSTSYMSISLRHERMEIGSTWLGYPYQGTGLNTHVKYLMLSHAFEVMGIQRIEFKADALNIQSRKAMEKIGAQYEGILRSHTILSDGRRRDTVYYSILASEWSDVKKNLINKINQPS